MSQNSGYVPSEDDRDSRIEATVNEYQSIRSSDAMPPRGGFLYSNPLPGPVDPVSPPQNGSVAEGKDVETPEVGYGFSAGPAKFEIADPESAIPKNTGPYAGMPKEVLLQYSEQPLWVGLRWFFLTIFIVAGLGLIAWTVFVIMTSPSCLPWWQDTVIYQIYPRSFKDSDGDGIGDIKGIHEKLGYLDDLGVKTVWLSPIFPSPMKDFGYDVSDYTGIWETFGTLDDFQRLLDAMHERGMKLILDFVPNHTSDQHEWFNKSRAREEPYTDYYVWKDCSDDNDGDGIPDPPPTDWRSVFTESMWQWDDTRGQCYLHQFLVEQPDLNLRNKDVKQELTDVVRTWLSRGVDGFRVDAIAHGLEEPTYTMDAPEAPCVAQGNCGPDPYYRQLHNYTFEYDPDTLHGIIQGWRDSVLTEYSNEPEKYRFMVTEVYLPPQGLTRYYGSNGKVEADFPFNFQLISGDSKYGNLPDYELTGTKTHELVDSWLKEVPARRWPNWVLGNHDNHRLPNRFNPEYSRAMVMMLMMLPGTPTTYYGEEIGMSDITPEVGKTQDPFCPDSGDPMDQSGTFFATCRDYERAPMQWSAESNAGFSDNNETDQYGWTTWLPVNSDYQQGVNVEEQQSATDSALSMYKALIAMRGLSHLAIHRGWFCYVLYNENTFAFVRELEGAPGYLIAMNLGDQPLTDDYFALDVGIPLEGTIAVSTGMDRNGDRVQLNKLDLAVGEGLVIEYAAGHNVHKHESMEEGRDCYIFSEKAYVNFMGILSTFRVE
ncbi:neutral and basic amino acid transport protein rBAT-like [Branchiostoma floridae]|uniref:Neutral and basic amino acid transport protein rBAT-like n=1 Tax=Branchiostoma floridae TaxID=7739 RepID=A0A9J7N768_BRAFL|nr:neutral and basic amino acid transport protein rBAT-like [Branchiostoma floridae]